MRYKVETSFHKTVGKWEFGNDSSIISPAIMIRRMTLDKAVDWYFVIGFLIWELRIAIKKREK